MQDRAWPWVCAALRGDRAACQQQQAALDPAAWERVAALIEFHECAPLVWDTVRDATLPGAAVWRSEFYATALLNERRIAALLPWLAEMARWDAQPILLKGAALLATTYASYGQRQMADIDLLVAWPALPRAWAVLSAAQFLLLPQPMPAWQWRTSGELRLVQQGSGAFVELHWLLYAGVWADQSGLHAVWPATRQISLAGAKVLVLEPAEQLLHLAFHLAISNQFGKGLGRMLVDLDRAARDPALDWSRLWRLARARGLHAVLASALRLSAHWLATPLERPWQTLIRGPQRAVLERLLPFERLAAPQERPARWRRMVQLALAPSLAAQARLLATAWSLRSRD